MRLGYELRGKLHVAERLDVALEALAAGLLPMWVVDFATFAPLGRIEALTVVYGAENERQAAGLVARWRSAGREVFPLRASSEERAAA